jgi:hypothetical protein
MSVSVYEKEIQHVYIAALIQVPSSERRRRTNNNSHVVPNRAHSLEPLTDRESENTEFSRRRTYGRAVPFAEIGENFWWKNLSTAANAGPDRFPRANLRAGSIPRPSSPAAHAPRAGGQATQAHIKRRRGAGRGNSSSHIDTTPRDLSSSCHRAFRDQTSRTDTREARGFLWKLVVVEPSIRPLYGLSLFQACSEEDGNGGGGRGGGAEPAAGVPVPPHGRGAGGPLPLPEGGAAAAARVHHRRGRSLQVRPVGPAWCVRRLPPPLLLPLLCFPRSLLLPPVASKIK